MTVINARNNRAIVALIMIASLSASNVYAITFGVCYVTKTYSRSLIKDVKWQFRACQTITD